MNTATVGPMTKERAGEILLAIAINAMKEVVGEDGPITPEDCSRAVNELTEEFPEFVLPPEEARAFVDFLMNEANQASE